MPARPMLKRSSHSIERTPNRRVPARMLIQLLGDAQVLLPTPVSACLTMPLEEAVYRNESA